MWISLKWILSVFFVTVFFWIHVVCVCVCVCLLMCFVCVGQNSDACPRFEAVCVSSGRKQNKELKCHVLDHIVINAVESYKWAIFSSSAFSLFFSLSFLSSSPFSLSLSFSTFPFTGTVFEMNNSELRQMHLECAQISDFVTLAAFWAALLSIPLTLSWRQIIRFICLLVHLLHSVSAYLLYDLWKSDCGIHYQDYTVCVCVCGGPQRVYLFIVREMEARKIKCTHKSNPF